MDSKNQPITPFAPLHDTFFPTFLEPCIIMCHPSPPAHLSRGKRPKPRPQPLGHAAPPTRGRNDLLRTDCVLHDLRGGTLAILSWFLGVLDEFLRRLLLASIVVLPHVAPLVVLLRLAGPARVVLASLGPALALSVPGVLGVRRPVPAAVLELPVGVVLLRAVLVLVDLRVVDVLDAAVVLDGRVAVLAARLCGC